MQIYATSWQWYLLVLPCIPIIIGSNLPAPHVLTLIIWILLLVAGLSAEVYYNMGICVVVGSLLVIMNINETYQLLKEQVGMIQQNDKLELVGNGTKHDVEPQNVLETWIRDIIGDWQWIESAQIHRIQKWIMIEKVKKQYLNSIQLITKNIKNLNESYLLLALIKALLALTTRALKYCIIISTISPKSMIVWIYYPSTLSQFLHHLCFFLTNHQQNSSFIEGKCFNEGSCCIFDIYYLIVQWELAGLKNTIAQVVTINIDLGVSLFKNSCRSKKLPEGLTSITQQPKLSCFSSGNLPLSLSILSKRRTPSLERQYKQVTKHQRNIKESKQSAWFRGKCKKILTYQRSQIKSKDNLQNWKMTSDA